jgi:hypothetical protein
VHQGQDKEDQYQHRQHEQHAASVGMLRRSRGGRDEGATNSLVMVAVVSVVTTAVMSADVTTVSAGVPTSTVHTIASRESGLPA